jgi:hypothetical protein
MTRFLPSFRLIQVARRLQAEHPDPPRRVSLLEVLDVYTPLLASIFIVLVAILLVPGKPRSVAATLVLLGVMALGGLLLAGGLVTGAKGALEKGVLTTGEVVSARSGVARMRTTVIGRDLEVTFTSLRAGSLRTGDRFNVLVDPQKETVLMVIGRAEES